MQDYKTLVLFLNWSKTCPCSKYWLSKKFQTTSLNLY